MTDNDLISRSALLGVQTPRELLLPYVPRRIPL